MTEPQSPGQDRERGAAGARQVTCPQGAGLSGSDLIARTGNGLRGTSVTGTSQELKLLSPRLKDPSFLQYVRKLCSGLGSQEDVDSGHSPRRARGRAYYD